METRYPGSILKRREAIGNSEVAATRACCIVACNQRTPDVALGPPRKEVPLIVEKGSRRVPTRLNQLQSVIVRPRLRILTSDPIILKRRCSRIC